MKNVIIWKCEDVKMNRGFADLRGLRGFYS